MRESIIENYLVNKVNALGGFTRKLQWIGHNGAPDRIVILNGKTMFIELKATGGKVRVIQAREHDRMKSHGADVRVVSSLEQVDEVLCEVA